jgi:hypothetical protein
MSLGRQLCCQMAQLFLRVDIPPLPSCALPSPSLSFPLLLAAHHCLHLFPSLSFCLLLLLTLDLSGRSSGNGRGADASERSTQLCRLLFGASCTLLLIGWVALGNSCASLNLVHPQGYGDEKSAS